MSGTILVYEGAAPGLIALLKQHYKVLGPSSNPGKDLTQQEQGEVRAFVGLSRVSADIIDALPNLGLIVCIGSGYDNVDLAAARRRGIAIATGSGANADSVAELAVALLLASIRNVVAGDRVIRSGGWPKAFPRSPLPYARGLRGRRVGVFGLGMIGRRIAELVSAFGADVGYHNRSEQAASAYRYLPSLPALAEWADILVVAVRATKETNHAVNAAVLQKLGPDGHVVNIARGSVIDENALIAALQSGQIAGAALDVFEHEPNVPAGLIDQQTTVLTPHQAGTTVEAAEAGRARALENLAAFFDGKPIPGRIDF